MWQVKSIADGGTFSLKKCENKKMVSCFARHSLLCIFYLNSMMSD